MQTMKRNLMSITVIVAIATGGYMIAHGQGQSPAAPAGPATTNAAPPAGLNGQPMWHRPPNAMQGGPTLERFAEMLNLTPEQKTKVQPIFDQATPQIQAIRQEAMQKTQAVMESAMAQIRPLLTPEQVAKLDQMKQSRQNMHTGEPGRPMHDGSPTDGH